MRGWLNLTFDEQDKVILNFACITCDNVECNIGPKYYPPDSLVGCSRWVSQEEYAKYIHYINEVIPFWKNYSVNYVNNSYLEISSFLQKIYSYPIVHRLDKKGQVIGG